MSGIESFAVQLDRPNGLAEIFRRGLVSGARSPCPQQAADRGQEEIPAAERGFQQSFLGQGLVLRVADQIENEFDNFGAGKYCAARFRSGCGGQFRYRGSNLG